MGTTRDADALPMLEMACPEIFATHIGRIEPAGGGNVRVYVCVQRGRAIEPIYTVVIPIENLAVMARQCQHAVSDVHNRLQFEEMQTAH